MSLAVSPRLGSRGFKLSNLRPSERASVTWDLCTTAASRLALLSIHGGLSDLTGDAYTHLNMTSIAHFPFLSDAEFEQACSEIQAVSEYDTLKSPDLTLRLTRPLPAQHAICNPDGQAQDECSETLEEADEELLVVQSTTSSDALIYDIILSPSYRVPVVYIHTNFPLSNTKQLYDLIVPQSSRSAMEETGVLGALSLTVRDPEALILT